MPQSIHDQIQALHRQLTELHRVEPDIQEQLLILQADINRLLDANIKTDREHSPTEAVETLAARFDADHPALSAALRNLLDSLGKAGI
ncbi:MAG: DUF4404 family protein [Steroidobacteraceae bacterium]